MQLTSTLKLVVEYSSNAAIEILSIKGPILALLALSDLSIRHSRDIYVLIAPQHLQQAIVTLNKKRFFPCRSALCQRYIFRKNVYEIIQGCIFRARCER